MKIRSMGWWARVALLAMTAPLGASATARADDTPEERAVDAAVEKIADEDPPKWDPRSVKPLATQNLRLQGGVGWISLRNPTDDILVEGIGANAHLHAGDTFFELVSYYVPLRATVMFFDQTTVGGVTTTSFNDKQALFVESGLGLEVWPWPGVIAISGEGVVHYFGLTTTPVVRAEPALNREAVGGAVRGRLTVQFNGIGVYGEYTHLLVLQDLTTGSNWEGSQIFVGLTYHIGEKFDF